MAVIKHMANSKNEQINGMVSKYNSSKGAFVSVSLYGNASSSAYDQMTGEICSILADELDIPGSNVYVTYQGIKDWGWNGGNF